MKEPSLKHLFALLENARKASPSPLQYQETVRKAREKVKNAGDVSGHPFRGNQWRDGNGNPIASGQKVTINDPMSHAKFRGKTGTVVRLIPPRPNGEAAGVAVNVPGIYESYVGHPSMVTGSAPASQSPNHSFSGMNEVQTMMDADADADIAKSHHPDHPPISNQLGGWMYNPDTSTYHSEFSALEHSGRHDPWGRPLITRNMKQEHDGDGDLTHIHGTILAPPAQPGTLGKAAKLTIFND